MNILQNLNLSDINLATGVPIRDLQKAQTEGEHVSIPQNITNLSIAKESYFAHFKEKRECASKQFIAIVKSILVFWRIEIA
jgi:hypothetical protein